MAILRIFLGPIRLRDYDWVRFQWVPIPDVEALEKGKEIRYLDLPGKIASVDNRNVLVRLNTGDFLLMKKKRIKPEEWFQPQMC